MGSFLSQIKYYSRYEQFFACGLHKVNYEVECKLNDLPKGLIKLCKQYDLELNNALIENYIANPDMFNNVFNMKFNSLSKESILSICCEAKQNYYYRPSSFKVLTTEYNYKHQSLLTYMDNLITYEALDGVFHTLDELKDYVHMMSRISPKYEKYPKNFLTTHKIACRNYNRLKEQFIEEDFQKQIDKKLEYVYGDYTFIYPQSTQDIKDEAVQQNNCVASYIKRVIDGECHILFMRQKDSRDKSLVTIEVRNGTVVQAKGKFNRDVTAREQNVIDKYNKRLERLGIAC